MLHQAQLSSWACALMLAACLAPSGTAAALLTASYSGTVTGSLGRPAVLDVFPVGTAVAWAFSFDDSFRTVPATGDVFGAAQQPLDGWLQIGADRIVLQQFGLGSYTFNSGTGAILRYEADLRGTGPTIAGDGHFDGLSFFMPPTLDAQDSPSVRYEFNVAGLGLFRDAVTIDGIGSIRPAFVVPAPAPLWLALPALVWLLGRRRACFGLRDCGNGRTA